MGMKHISYRRPPFPTDYHSACSLLYFRFTLSYRDVEDLWAESGIDVSHETICRWVEKFGDQYAKRLRPMHCFGVTPLT